MICPNVSRGDQCNNYDITSARNIFQSSSHSKIVSNTSQTHNKYLISLGIIIWNEKRFSKHCPEEIKAAIVSVWTKVTCCRFLKKWHDWFRLYILFTINMQSLTIHLWQTNTFILPNPLHNILKISSGHGISNNVVQKFGQRCNKVANHIFQTQCIAEG